MEEPGYHLQAARSVSARARESSSGRRLGQRAEQPRAFRWQRSEAEGWADRCGLRGRKGDSRVCWYSAVNLLPGEDAGPQAPSAGRCAVHNGVAGQD